MNTITKIQQTSPSRFFEISQKPHHRGCRSRNSQHLPLFAWSVCQYSTHILHCLALISTTPSIRWQSFLPEICAVWERLKWKIKNSWNADRGSKFRISSADSFFTTLSMLNHRVTWEFLTITFHNRAPTFQQCKTPLLEVAQPPFFNRYVTLVDKYNPIRALVEGSRTFTSRTYASYATDVPFQQINRPMRNIEEYKKYLSEKHKLFVYEFEVSAIPSGVKIGGTKHYPGSIAEIENYEEEFGLLWTVPIKYGRWSVHWRLWCYFSKAWRSVCSFDWQVIRGNGYKNSMYLTDVEAG